MYSLHHYTLNRVPMRSRYLTLFLLLSNLFFGCREANDTRKTAALRESPPNIVLLLAEDISTDLECYGMPAVKTPILNGLAETGIQFMHAYGANSICSPSRSNMITGVHQNIIDAQHHRSNRKIPLPEPYKPITYYLKEAGYTTIIGNPLVMGGSNKIDVNFKHDRLGAWNGKTEFGLFDKEGGFDPEDQPFFAQVTLQVTHRGDWWRRISDQSHHQVDPDSVVLPPFVADTRVIREDWARYLDQIEYMDHEVGLLLADLESKGLRDNTIIIFIGDNGRCNIRGKGYLYETGLHLPLIVNWPANLTGGKKDTRLVASMDVAATILDAAGVELPEYMTARSIIRENLNPREYVYSARDLWDEILEQSRAITTPDFRYIRNHVTGQPHDAHQAYLEFYRPALHSMRSLNKEGKLNELQYAFFSPTKPEEELYDRINDPYETQNLIDQPDYAEVANRMRGYFDHWNSQNLDRGFEPLNWDHVSPSLAGDVLEWLKLEKPKVIEEMERGIEPGFGKWVREYRKQVETQ